MILAATLTCVLGYSLSRWVSTELSILERLGASFWLGIGTQTLLMVLLDILGFGVYADLVFGCSVVLLGLSVGLDLQQRGQAVFFEEFRTLWQTLRARDWRYIQPAWLLLAAAALHLLYGISVKGLFDPTFSFDALAGYDLMGRAVSTEGTFANSLFMSNGQAIQGSAHRFVYPPMTSGMFAYAYLAGAQLPKIMTLLGFWSFGLLLYGLLRRLTTDFAAMLGVVLVLFIPEMTAHAALSLTNLPQGILVTTGLLSLWVAYAQKRMSHYNLAIVLLALNAWTRSEGVLFIALAFGLLLLDIRRLGGKRLGIYALGMVAPFLFWQLFLSLYHLQPAVEQQQLFALHWDATKWQRQIQLMFTGQGQQPGVFFNYLYFGWGVYFFLIALIPSVIFILWRRHTRAWGLLYLCLGSVVLYQLFYYVVDYSWDDMANVIRFSYKRGLFCIIPLLTLYVILNPLSIYGAERLKRWLSPSIEK